MSGRIYVVPWTGSILNADGNMDLWELNPADDRKISIRGIRLGQTSEIGDAQEEGLRITIRRFRATVTSGSGGSTGAPEEVGRSAQAPSFTCEVNNDVVATTTGDNEVLDELSWNIRMSPYEVWFPDDRFSPAAIQTEALLVRLEDTVTDDLTFAGNIWVEEE